LNLGVEKPLFAHKAFLELKELFLSCGIEESEQKAIAPSTRMEFLGIVCDISIGICL
jgi:hypothetical protein